MAQGGPDWGHSYLIQQLVRSLSADQLVRLRAEFSRPPRQTLPCDRFILCLTELLEAGQPLAKKRSSGDLWEEASPGRLNNVETLLTLFRQLDVNGDGEVSWDDVSSNILETVDSPDLVHQMFIDRPMAEVWKGLEVDKVTYVPGWQKEVHCTADRKVGLYYSRTGQPYAEYEGHQAAVLATCYVAPLQRLATSSADRTIIMWNRRTEAPAFLLEAPVPQISMTYDCSPDAAASRLDHPVLYSGGLDGVLRCWDLQDMREVKGAFGSERHSDWVTDLLIFPGTKLMASCSLDTTIRVWDLNLGECVYLRRGHAKGVMSLAYCETYCLLLSCGYGKEVLVWNPFSQQGPVHRIRGHDKPLVGVQVVPGAGRAITCDVAGRAMVWDLRNFACLQRLEDVPGKRNLAPTTAFFYDADHEQIVAYGFHRVVWPSRKPNEDRRFPVRVHLVLYNSVFRLLVVVVESDVYIHHGEDGSVKAVYSQVSDCEVTAMAFTPSERELLLCNLEGRLRLVNLLNGAVQQDVLAAAEEVRFLHCLRRDPRQSAAREDVRLALLVTAGREALLVDYQKPGREEVLSRFQVLPDVALTAFSARENLLALFSSRAMEVWSVTLSPVVKMKQLMTPAITGALFVDAQNCLVTCDAEGDLKVWGVPSLHVLLRHRLPGLAPCHLAYCGTVHTVVVADRQRLVTVDMAALVDVFFETHLHEPWNCRQTGSGVLFHELYYVDHRPTGTLRDGAAWPAVDLKSQRRVCIRFVSDEAKFQRCTLFADLLHGAAHFVCTPLHAFPPDPTHPLFALVMERSERQLVEFIASKSASPAELAFVAECAVRGLQELHAAGLVHCDVRASQLVRVDDRWKFADLSQAALAGAPVHFVPPAFYAAPELVPLLIGSAGHPVEAAPSLDMWALGLLLLGLATDRRLLEGLSEVDAAQVLQSPALEDRVARLPLPSTPLGDVIPHLLLRDPSQRWTIDQVVAHLEVTGYLSGYLIPPPTLRPFPRTVSHEMESVVVAAEDISSSTFDLCDSSEDHDALAAVRFTHLGALAVVDAPAVLFAADHVGRESYVQVFDLSARAACGRLPAEGSTAVPWTFPSLQATMLVGRRRRRLQNFQQLRRVDSATADGDPTTTASAGRSPKKEGTPHRAAKSPGTTPASLRALFAAAERRGSSAPPLFPAGGSPSASPTARPHGKAKVAPLPPRGDGLRPGLPLAFLCALPASEHFQVLEDDRPGPGPTPAAAGRPAGPRPRAVLAPAAKAKPRPWPEIGPVSLDPMLLLGSATKSGGSRRPAPLTPDTFRSRTSSAPSEGRPRSSPGSALPSLRSPAVK
eukprot:EG_transcript_513